tara:strand:- start:8173 stop:8655 length:483 start_codon:yes stop_codon:yes gene_type:complete
MHQPTTSIGRDHILHHTSTNIKTFDLTESPEMDNQQNLCFDIEICYIAFVIFMIYLFVLKKFTKNTEYVLYSILLFVTFLFFMIIIWNSIHPYIHNEDPSKRCKYHLFKSYIDKKKNNFYIRWMIWNHKLHHIRKGKRKGNYNIVFPGADYLLGTAYTTI